MLRATGRFLSTDLIIVDLECNLVSRGCAECGASGLVLLDLIVCVVLDLDQ